MTLKRAREEDTKQIASLTKYIKNSESESKSIFKFYHEKEEKLVHSKWCPKVIDISVNWCNSTNEIQCFFPSFRSLFLCPAYLTRFTFCFGAQTTIC